jgi:hypothetical protein
MTGIEDLLERIEVPVVNLDDDLARGERALRRRRGWQVSAAVVSVAAVVCGGAAVRGSASAPGAGPAVAPGNPSATKAHHPDARAAKARHRMHQRLISARQAERRAERQLSSRAGQQTIQTYHDVLAEHLDPGGDKLRLAQNEQSGGDSFGTKLDWNGGGMLEIVVGRAWNDVDGFANLDSVGMTDTTYQGQPARVSTLGDDLVVAVRHPDGPWSR